MESHQQDEPVRISAFALALAGALLSGSLAAQPPEQPSILISRQLAELEQIAVGGEVRLATNEQGTRARAFRVAGIYEPTPDPMRLGAVPREVRLHLTD